VKKLGRRRFLAWVGAGAALGGATVAVVRSRGYHLTRELADKLVVLSPWQYIVLEAIGARLVAPESADVAAFADGYLADLAESDRRDVLRLIGYVEHVAPLGLGLFRRFTALGEGDQDRVLASLEQSRIDLLRAGFQALKAMAMMAYYRKPESWPALGYGGPVVKW
jgi:hypothetical protein